MNYDVTKSGICRRSWAKCRFCLFALLLLLKCEEEEYDQVEKVKRVEEELSPDQTIHTFEGTLNSIAIFNDPNPLFERYSSFVLLFWPFGQKRVDDGRQKVWIDVAGSSETS